MADRSTSARVAVTRVGSANPEAELVELAARRTLPHLRHEGNELSEVRTAGSSELSTALGASAWASQVRAASEECRHRKTSLLHSACRGVQVSAEDRVRDPHAVAAAIGELTSSAELSPAAFLRPGETLEWWRAGPVTVAPLAHRRGRRDAVVPQTCRIRRRTEVGSDGPTDVPCGQSPHQSSSA